MSAFTHEIAIIGTGRVGLPLGIMLCSKGLSCFGIDKNEATISQVNQKEMPFLEPGFERLIKEVDFRVYNDFSKIQSAKNLIITVGTPVLAHIETDISQIEAVIGKVLPHLQSGQNIILRSTVAPGTTQYVKNRIEKDTRFSVGEDIFLSFCPERIAEGKSFKELTSLPQIIGSEDEKSYERAEQVFSNLAPKIFKTSYLSAELTKLFNNTQRYINFAMSNQFALIAETYGQDIYQILEMANTDYPRGGIFSPGFTAGTCLRKDFGMLNEAVPYADLFLTSWKINEYMPKFLLESVLKHKPVLGKKVAVLGYTFKKDTDDTRDSLVPKLMRYIEREVPASIRICEPHLGNTIEDEYQNYSLEEAIADADIIFISTNHSQFIEKREAIFDGAKTGACFSDIWNVLGKQKICFTK